MLNTFEGLSSDYYQDGVGLADDADRQGGVRGLPIGVQVRCSGHLLIVVNRTRVPFSCRPSFTERERVVEFSVRSAQRMRRYLRESLADYKIMLTLTYPMGLGEDGARAKRDLCAMLKRMRRYVENVGVDVNRYSAFWFLEFQSRGAVHFHLFLTHRFPKEWIAKSWYEIVGSEDKRHLAAGTRIESFKGGKHGISAYATKYAAKQTQKEVPAGFGDPGRFWGVSGYRCTMSADAFVSHDIAEVKSVKRKLSVINAEISDALDKGKAVKIEKVEGAHVFYVKSLAVMAKIKWAVEALAHCVAMEQPWSAYDYFAQPDEWDA